VAELQVGGGAKVGAVEMLPEVGGEVDGGGEGTAAVEQEFQIEASDEEGFYEAFRMTLLSDT